MADNGDVHGALSTYVFSSLTILSMITKAAPLCANSSSSHTSQPHIFSTTLKHTPNGLRGTSRNPDTIFSVQTPGVHKRVLFVCGKRSVIPLASKQKPEAAEMLVKTSVGLLQASLNKRSSSSRVNEPAKLTERHS